MTEREQSLYQYLTLWADFSPAEARAAVRYSSTTNRELRHETHWRVAADDSINCSMEQSKNRRAA